MSTLSYDLNKGRKLNQFLNQSWNMLPKNWNIVSNNLSNMFKDIDEAMHNSQTNCVAEARLDVYEDGKNYEIVVELPSVKKENVKIIATSDAQIDIKASKTFSGTEEQNAQKQALIRERYFGNIERSVIFEKKINKNEITAKWNNGELTIIVPKAVSEEPKEIEIA